MPDFELCHFRKISIFATKTRIGITFVMMQDNENELNNINHFAEDIGAELE